MSETTTTLAPSRTPNTVRPYPPMLPQWALEICRPIVVFLSRVLWGIRWRHKEYIPATGGVIIAANHQTYLDPFWIASQVRRPVRFLAWDAAFNWPVVGSFLRLFGAWPLQLEGSDPAPIRRSIQWLNEGGAVVIFPEGGRGNADGTMRKFKPGAVRMAMEAGVPILPVTIRGGERVWPADRRLPRLGRIEIIYHPLFVIDPNDDDQRGHARRASDALQEIVGSALNEKELKSD